jgi:hypothetical protein
MKLPINSSDARAITIVAALCLSLLISSPALSIPTAAPPSPLDHGFTDLYNLDFAGARQDFATWQTQHPDDPMGPVSEAAGIVFAEFDRLGVLEAQFFESDDAFFSRSKLTPDPGAKKNFQAALGRADTLAHARLAKDAKDRDALFALTLSSGLQADYAGLVEKRNFASLRYTKEATLRAQQLLAVCSDCYDALLATGFTKYLVGSLYAPWRWALRIGGISGDKEGGIADLKLTAERGHYLAPLARILLAIAYVREKQKPQALDVLNGLRTDFPANTLVSREIARLQNGH